MIAQFENICFFFVLFFLNQDNKTTNGTLNVPTTSTVISGSCGNGTEDQNILLQWKTGNDVNIMLLEFHLNQTEKEFALSGITFELNTAQLPNGKNETVKFYHVSKEFVAPYDMSYHCNREQTLNLTSTEKSNVTIGTVTVSHLTLEAFHKGKSSQFSTASDCDAINTPGKLCCLESPSNYYCNNIIYLNGKEFDFDFVYIVFQILCQLQLELHWLH